MTDQIQQIRQRRAAVENIEITDETPDRGQHYGYVLGVGNNQLGTLWHCSDDRTHPDHAAVLAEGGDVADLYCNSHYASVADEAAFEFLLKAKGDVQALLDERSPAQTFQARTAEWILACFGPEVGADKIERHHRFLEEALELVQATGCTEAEAAQLVAYVYGRPVGEARQEVGGVMLTLAALCSSHGLEMQIAGETELARVWTKVEQIRAKQAAKPKHSPLPEVAQMVQTRHEAFEHRVEFFPGYDDVPSGRGIDGGEFYFTVIGPDGAVAFQLLNNWYPATITTNLEALHRMMPMGGVVSWHARGSWDGEPPERVDCPYLNGPCFVRTSYSEGDGLKQILLEQGTEGLWKELEEFYVRAWGVPTPQKPELPNLALAQANAELAMLNAAGIERELLQQALEMQTEAAERWEALLHADRFKLWGWAGVNSDGSRNPDKSAHFGMEAWAIHPGEPSEFEGHNVRARQILTVFADAVRLRRPAPQAPPSPVLLARPAVVCLCGPTRYREAYAEANAWFTLQGYVVLSCGVFKGDPWYNQTPKVALDELHLRKIDMAQIAVFIGGEAAAGESTRAELAYAWAHGKQVSEWKLEGGGLRGMNRPEAAQ